MTRLGKSQKTRADRPLVQLLVTVWQRQLRCCHHFSHANAIFWLGIEQLCTSGFLATMLTFPVEMRQNFVRR